MADWYEEGKRRISDTMTPEDGKGSFDLSSPRLLDQSLPPSATNESSPFSSTAQLPHTKVDESVIKLRVDDGWNFRALWTGRIKELLVSAGFTVGPASSGPRRLDASGTGSGSGNGVGSSPLRGTIGVEVFYSS